MSRRLPDADRRIIVENLSKFYGDVLGINRVNLSIPPGITSLVGPNGSGKTTLLNLLTGLIRPTRGSVSVFGISPEDPERFFREVGYCTQFDTFGRGLTGYGFVHGFLRLYGCDREEAATLAWRALERVNLTEGAHRKIASYSKGMRQRIKLAQATCHGPSVLILDEPLNGLDPLVRAETIALFKSLAAEGMHVIISSHILHEVDAISDQVILLRNGYVVAEGEIRGVRSEMKGRPMQVMVRCSKPGLLAAKLFEQDQVVEAKLHNDGGGLHIKTTDADRFYLLLNRIALDGIGIESIAPADDDVGSVYEYLIGGGEATAN